MNCYYHKSVEAVATCKNCGRGLCADCCVDIGNGEACRNRCEDAARQITSLISRNVQAAGAKKVTRRPSEYGMFFLTMGLVLLVAGFLGPKAPHWLADFPGFELVGLVVWYFSQAKKTPK